MNVIYNSVDITDSVRVRSCECVDASRDRCDSLEITFENPEAWYRWDPQIDDTIEVVDGVYSTGAMYIASILPEDAYTILALSIPQALRQKKWESFEGFTLAQLFDHIASPAGMGWALYGIAANTVIQYIVRQNESGAAFLNRVMMLEGGVLKIVNGTINGIGIEWAQSQDTMQTMEMKAGADGFQYRKHSDMELGSLTVHNYSIDGTAKDTDAESDLSETMCLPAGNVETAGRWARGMLLSRNRMTEELEVSSTFAPGWTAMGRMDIESTTGVAGEWIADEVRHDFIKRTSTMTLLRCRTGVV